MENREPFDFSKPTADTLAGVYVEACDSDAAMQKGSDSKSSQSCALPLSALFGVTQTVSDRTDAAPPNAAAPK
jgi:hypothetical protein